jgi:hypothetical protein
MDDGYRDLLLRVLEAFENRRIASRTTFDNRSALPWLRSRCAWTASPMKRWHCQQKASGTRSAGLTMAMAPAPVPASGGFGRRFAWQALPPPSPRTGPEGLWVPGSASGRARAQHRCSDRALRNGRRWPCQTRSPTPRAVPRTSAGRRPKRGRCSEHPKLSWCAAKDLNLQPTD